MRRREIRAIDSLSVDQPIELRYGGMAVGIDVHVQKLLVIVDTRPA